ncbi:MAG: glutamine-hydrolyzing GMP synthase, partial [Bdellovibrionota bacterium]
MSSQTQQKHSVVVILDFGSQYTQLIARRVREMGIYSIIIHGDEPFERVLSHAPSALILSGGPASVYDPGSPQLAPGFVEGIKNAGLPVLGICYGMQVLAQAYGGKVEKSPHREYGRMPIRVESHSTLLGAWARAQGINGDHEVWMSHGDEVRTLPPGFRITAKSTSGALASIENDEARVYLVQFHPEVTHTREGAQILRQFITGVARVTSDWNMASHREDQL